MSLALYKRLKPWQTRLLELLPGEAADGVRANLLVADTVAHEGMGLTEEGRFQSFEAVSYSWGHRPPGSTITCNGEAVLINNSLAVALRYLRYQQASRWLWCDAVCINQKDDEEKSNQVRMMMLIFSKAETVVAWLGLDDVDTSAVFDTCRSAATSDGHPEILKKIKQIGSLQGHFNSLMGAANLLTDHAERSRKPTAEQDSNDAGSFGVSHVSRAMKILKPQGQTAESYEALANTVREIVDTEQRIKKAENMRRLFRGTNTLFDQLLGSEGVPNLDDNLRLDEKMIDELVTKLKTGDRVRGPTVPEEPLAAFCSRSWFSRTWVRQEVFAARQIMLQCGRHTIPFSQFATEAIRKGQAGLSLNSLQEIYGQIDMRPMTSDQSRHQADDLQQRQRVASKYLEVLRAGAAFGVTDDRDRVYGLVSMIDNLVRNSYEPLRIDYSRDLSQVFQDVTKYLIKISNSLNVIELFRPDGRPANLPSWTIDWRHDCAHFYSSISTTGAQPQDLEHESELRVRGFRIGQLGQIISAGEIAQWRYPSNPPRVQINDGPEPDKVSRLRRMDFDVCLRKTGLFVDRLIRTTNPEEATDSCGVSAPRVAEDSNWVFVLEGSNLPFILRETEVDGAFHLVSPAWWWNATKDRETDAPKYEKYCAFFDVFEFEKACCQPSKPQDLSSVSETSTQGQERLGSALSAEDMFAEYFGGTSSRESPKHEPFLLPARVVEDMKRPGRHFPRENLVLV